MRGAFARLGAAALAVWAYKPVRHGAIVAVFGFAVIRAAMMPGEGGDAHAYWAARGDLYAQRVGDVDAYLYSPAVAQILTPFQLLPWQAFHILYAALTAGVLVAMVGPFALVALLFPPITLEFLTLNIHLLYAGAIIVGFRYPGAWALMLLTKITPGVGLVWFAVRREWRALAIAFAWTGAIVVISYVLAPALWTDWIGALTRSTTKVVDVNYIPVPLAIRLPIAVAVAAWGGLTNRRWAVPISVTLAMPVLWTTSLSILIAAIPLAVEDRRSAARRRTTDTSPDEGQPAAILGAP